MSNSVASLFVNSDKYTLTSQSGAKLHPGYVENGFVQLKSFYKGSALDLLRKEVDRLSANSIRRDFRMSETHDTPRLLSTLNGDVIDRYSSIDCVCFAANKSIHRVSPLNKPSTRIAIASAFANKETLNAVSYSSDKLYGNTSPS